MITLMIAIGLIDPAVTQANIHKTICVPGYSAKVRPDVRYTEAIKRRRMLEELLPGRLSDYELDHVVPLCAGGSPRDERNLKMQPIAEAKQKDSDEKAICKAICDGRVTLDQAQQVMMNWDAEVR